MDVPAGDSKPSDGRSGAALRIGSMLPELIDMIDDAVVVTSADLQPPGPFIEFVNAAFERMTGYGANEAIGRSPRFLQGPHTSRAELERMRRELEAGDHFSGEIVNYRKDGTPFVIEWRIKAIRDRDGALAGWLSVQRDVTAQRRLANDQRRLAREVDHRAKNALALVQGIVRLTHADDARSYAEAVQGRVDALATAHTLLSETGWRGVALKRLVDSGLANLDYMGEASVAGPDVDLPSSLVQPVALLVHELVCNAVKHGGLIGRSGRLTIEWAVADGELVINWLERGGPPPAAERRSGFGLPMIDAIVRRQLGGLIDFDWQPAGLSIKIRLALRRPSL